MFYKSCDMQINIFYLSFPNLCAKKTFIIKSQCVDCLGYFHQILCGLLSWQMRKEKIFDITWKMNHMSTCKKNSSLKPLSSSYDN
jgi:hypothetical protein